MLARVATAALVALASIVMPGSALAKTKYVPCDPARYIVRGAQLIVGPGEPLGTDAVTYAPSGVGVDSGCPSATPIRVRGTKNGTRVKVKWASCQNIFGSALMTGRIDKSCQTMTGVFKAKRAKVRKAFTATKSFCGDGVHDPVLEECEGDSGCTGAICTAECTCGQGTSTTTSAPTTSSGPTTTNTTTTSTTSTTSNAKPDLVPTAYTSNVATIVAGQQMNVSWTVKNQGAASATGTWYDQVYLSADQFVSNDDTTLTYIAHTGPLAVNGTYSNNGQSITIPSNTPAGTYYLLLRADSYTYVAESDEGNNDATPIQITVQTPDLVPTAFSAASTTIVSGQQTTVSWTVKNQGTGAAMGTWYDQVWLSTDQFYSQNDTSLTYIAHSGPLAADGTYTANNQSITIPSNQAPGTYYLLFRTDAFTGLVEADESNNDWPTPIQITVQTPDLVPTAFSSSATTIVSGQQLTVSWTVKNQGDGAAYGTWYDQVWLSTDQFYSQNDTSLTYITHSGPLAANGTYSVNNQAVTIPSNLTAGTYYLVFRTDAFSNLFETDEGNNEWGMPVQITVQTPDLVPTAFSSSATTIVSGQQLNVSWTVKNQGTGTAYGTWYDQVWLSTDQFIGATDVSLGYVAHSGPLAANGTYSVNNQAVTIPSNQPAGTYYLVFRTDAFTNLFEDAGEGNNDWPTPIQITVQVPDLVPTAFSASGMTVVSGQQLNVSWTVKNQGTGTAYGTWYDQVWLSTDQFIGATDVSLGYVAHSGPLAADGTYSVNNQAVTIPSNQPAGTYYLVFRTDAFTNIFEDGQDGNNDWPTPIQITVQVPDLVPTAFSAASTTITHGTSTTVSWTVQNQGSGTAYGNWYDQVWLSTDQFIGATDVSLGYVAHSGPLAANGTYSVNGQTITIPANQPAGTYYLVFRTDAFTSIFEDGQESNNDWPTPIQITVN